MKWAQKLLFYAEARQSSREMFLPRTIPTVNHKFGTCHERGLIACQKDHALRNIMGLTQATQRMFLK
jgi:hypothetical protein